MDRKLVRIALFALLALPAFAQGGPTFAPNHGTVTPSPQNEVAVYSNSGTQKTVAGDSSLTDSSGTLNYTGANGINSNNGFSSSGASGAGLWKCAQGTEISPSAGYIGWLCPATITTPFWMIPPGAPAGDTLNRMVTGTLDGSGNENILFGAPAPVGCTSGCNYVLTTADQVSGPGSAGSAISTANQGQYIQFFNNAYRKLATGCVEVTTLDSGGHVDVGVYSISGTTGTLVWHTGSLSTTSTGTQCVSPTGVFLLPGTNYYVAWCMDNTTSIIEALTGAGVVSTAGPAHSFGVDATDTCTTGVLPGTITTTNITNTSTHMVIPYVYVND